MMLLKKIIFKNAGIPFVGGVFPKNASKEKVFLENPNSTGSLEVSAQHWVVSQEPFTIATWNTKNIEEATSLVFYFNNSIVGKITLVFVRKIQLGNGALFLFKCTNAVSVHLTIAHRCIMLSYLRFRFRKDAKNIGNFCVAYSYPRKVVLVSFMNDKEFNIFPMDFQGYIAEGNRYILGLRQTNPTLGEIFSEKKIVVCNVPEDKKEIIYQLGKHHRKKTGSERSFTFSFQPSTLFNIPIPDFAYSYYEIQLDAFESLGSHTLLIGKVVNQKKIRESGPELSHVHVMHYLHIQRNSRPAEPINDQKRVNFKS